MSGLGGDPVEGDAGEGGGGGVSGAQGVGGDPGRRRGRRLRRGLRSIRAMASPESGSSADRRCADAGEQRAGWRPRMCEPGGEGGDGVGGRVLAVGDARRPGRGRPGRSWTGGW